uniref:EamA domain-containing protein n=2 Tax=Amphimedon queenslandica TaxID=400682 RepID=A0A1X7TNP1_AMPQE
VWLGFAKMASLLEANSVLSGLLASLASVVSKIGLEEGNATLKLLLCLSNDKCTENQELLLKVLQLLCLMLVGVCNVIMFVLFARALQKHSSTAQATVTVSTCNFIFSSVFGWALFGEALNLMWWCGFSLIVLGFVLIIYGQNNDKNKTL